jgi:hypothetical protein
MVAEDQRVGFNLQVARVGRIDLEGKKKKKKKKSEYWKVETQGNNKTSASERMLTSNGEGK